jgi:hypothetical protein
VHILILIVQIEDAASGIRASYNGFKRSKTHPSFSIKAPKGTRENNDAVAGKMNKKACRLYVVEGLELATSSARILSTTSQSTARRAQEEM